MPSSTACSKPSAFAASANSCSSAACSSIFSLIVSQPRRLPISGTPGPPQSDSSFCHTRRATPSDCACFTRSTIGGSRSSGSADAIVGGRPVTIPSRVSSTPPISASNGSTNFSMPSRSSVSVTSRMSIPALASALEVGRRVLVGRGAAHLELVGAGHERRHRHRVHRVRRHQPRHVLGLGVLRVLDAGRGPERALHRAAGLAQAREPLALEELLVAHVGGAGVGDRRDAAQLARCRTPPGACPPRCPRATRRSSPPSARPSTRRASSRRSMPRM